MRLTLPCHQGEGHERVGFVDKKFALGFAQSISWKHSCNLEACALLPDEKVPKADEVKLKAVRSSTITGRPLF